MHRFGQARHGILSLARAGASSVVLLGAALVTASVPGTPNVALAGVGAAPPIDHIVVIFLENRSFDSLYGLFPGADGLAQAGAAPPQVDEAGEPYAKLPPFNGPPINPAAPPVEIPALPNAPFDLAPYAPVDRPINASIEMVNNFYQEQMAIDGGKMDRFVVQSGSPTMGYYDGSQLPMWQFAQQYTLADHFFHAAFGGTGINHFWLACACTAVWPDAPADLVAQIAPDGTLIKDGLVSPDGYLVNNLGPAHASELPLQTMPHIGDRLDGAGVSWAWYTRGWNSGNHTPNYPPFTYFADMAPGTPGESLHLKDEIDFVDALQSGTLPSVAFLKPGSTAHPVNGGGLLPDDQWVADLVQAIQASPYWSRSAIIVTYDEGHSFWDHVAPPVVDRWGPGRRVPAIIISPYAKRGFVDDTEYDTTSILRFIEWRWNLPPLTSRDANANNLLNAFDFTQ